MRDKNDDMRSAYSPDLIKSGIRGKFVRRYREGTNIVLIDPDLREQFPDSESVNKDLRECLEKQRESASSDQLSCNAPDEARTLSH
jgi:hypothetical protein